MSIDTEIAKGNQTFEYILCIEGLGWPVDESEATFASGFDGDVFVTADFDGTLATKLGCTIHGGLQLPTGVSDSYDWRDNKYEHGGMTFDVIDVDEFLMSAIVPHKTANVGALNAAITVRDDDIVIKTYEYAASSVVWIAGREAVLLGSKAGAGPWTYTDCTRGYLGTPKGRADHHPTISLDGFAWDTNTTVRDIATQWGGRRVMLLIHVPGEAVTAVERVYIGHLTNIPVRDNGLVWSFPAVHSATGRLNRKHYIPKGWFVAKEEFVLRPGEYVSVGGQPTTGNAVDSPMPSGSVGVTETNIGSYYRRIWLAFGQWTAKTRYDSYGLWFAYRYRNYVDGGTKNAAYYAYLGTSPQTVTDGNSRELFHTLCRIGNKTLRGLHTARDAATGAAAPYKVIDFESENIDFNAVGTAAIEKYTPVQFLLDNMSEEKTKNWFTVNRRVTRNPIDVLLMFLTSCNGEFWVGDVTGGTTTVPTFAADTFVADQWNGYALHSVEDTDTYGYARLISDTTTNTITVSNAFPAATSANKEVHVRNTIYDVLPFGWGLGIPWQAIDVTSFEDVRDLYLGTATLGKFALGETDGIDIWNLLMENIAQPYGLLLRHNRSTGKLECKFVGETVPTDTLYDTYRAVGSDEILSMGTHELVGKPPISNIGLKIRGRGTVTVPAAYTTRTYNGEQVTTGIASYVDKVTNAMSPGGKCTETIEIIAPEFDAAFEEGLTDQLEVSAMFHDVDTYNSLVPFMRGRIARASIPSVEVSMRLNVESFVGSGAIQSGDIISVTDNDAHNPINPFTGTRGWTNVLCRVLSTRFDPSDEDPGVDVRLQLLQASTSRKIAPAATVTAKGVDGDDYLTIYAAAAGTDKYARDDDDYDNDLFAVGDLIELRSITGAWKEDLTIAQLTSARIYVDENIASAISSGDYVTFREWSTANNTTNMEVFSAYADASETLDSDDAVEYF